MISPGDSMKNIKVLVTGSTAPGFVSLVKALRLSKKYNFTVVGSDYREELSSRLFSDKSFVLPDNRSSGFSQKMLDLCVKEEVEVVLPIRTDDLMPICKDLEAFRKAGVEPALAVTDPALMDIVLNKRKLMEYSQRVIGIEVPDFSVARNAEELKDAVEQLGYPSIPVVIKPS